LDLAPAVGTVLNTTSVALRLLILLCLKPIVFLATVRLPVSQCHQPQSSSQHSLTDGVSYRVHALEHTKGFHDIPLGVASSTVRSLRRGSIDRGSMLDTKSCDIYRFFKYIRRLQLVLNVVALMPSETGSVVRRTNFNAR
jgi:hypothetical protein